MTSLDHAQVCVSGPAGAPTLLLVHGSTVTHAMWRPQIETLAGEFHVIAPDLPGHGTRTSQSFTLCSAVAQIDEALTRHATGQAIIVGISLGGYVAIEYAARRPERVAGLVLASTTTNFTGLLGVYVRVVGWVLGRVIDEERQRAKLARDIRHKYASDIAEPLLAAGLYPRAAGEGFLELAGRDFLKPLAAIDRPVLFLNGADDTASRRGEAAFRAATRRGQVEVIPGAGHLCNLQQPARFTEATRRFARAVTDARVGTALVAPPELAPDVVG